VKKVPTTFCKRFVLIQTTLFLLALKLAAAVSGRCRGFADMPSHGDRLGIYWISLGMGRIAA